MERIKKFKIGDSVRRINDEHGSLEIGDVTVVIGYENNGVLLQSDKDMQLNYTHKEDNLELVETKNKI